jgi:excinuclease ABC subunit A
MGQKKIEMHFLPDVWVECDVCHGSRYNPETLAVKYHGKSIADVLDMRVGEALELFGNIPKIRVVLQTLVDVGLGYMSLGQPAPTMSGGEAQRVKLAAELARPSTGKTLYLLDEPTTGLHFDDVRKLLDVLHRLADLGNTVLVVEHNLDVIKTADWVIDLGPEAGIGGGRVVAQGTPEDVATQAFDRAREGDGLISHTGRILKEVLDSGPYAERAKFDPEAAAAAKLGDMEIADVGKQAKLPWEEDGPRWHTRDRVTTTGKVPKWEGAALAWVIDEVHKLGTFSPTNWNHRSVIEVAAPKKSDGWFLHAISGHEAYLKLVFRMPGRPFKQDQLAAKLALQPLSDTPGFEGFSRDDKRVEVGNWPGNQYAVVTVTRKAEIETPAFREFLAKAVETYVSQFSDKTARVEGQMPWKKDGEKWHLSDKGFPPGRPPKWDRNLLPRLLALVREVEPKVEVKWDSRDAILLYLPGCTRNWTRWKTKETAALECRFLGKPGQFNLGRIEEFGVNPTLEGDRNDGGEMATLYFVRADQLYPAELKKFLADHAQGFLEHFGKDEAA